MSEFLQSKWAEGMSYAAYRQLMGRLVAEEKTTGPNQSKEMAYYTSLNEQRMHRLDKRLQLTPDLQQVASNLQRRYHWLVLTEAWCGDAAQVLPVLEKIAEAAGDHVEMRFLLRDEHLDLMDQYLTNGGRSIPKIICMDAQSGAEIGTWGPRPTPAQALLDAAKAEGKEYPEIIKDLQLWYARDKSQHIQAELLDAVSAWEAVRFTR